MQGTEKREKDKELKSEAAQSRILKENRKIIGNSTADQMAGGADSCITSTLFAEALFTIYAGRIFSDRRHCTIHR